jgi:predicted membrane protein
MATFSLFGDIKRINRSARIDGEELISVFGDVKIDFTQAPLEPGEQLLNIIVLFGDVKLRFPDHVGIEISGFSVFGDIELEDLRAGSEETPGAGYRSANYEQAAQRVHIKVAGVFGDLKLVLVPMQLDPAAHSLAEQRGYLPAASVGTVITAYEGETSRLGALPSKR